MRIHRVGELSTPTLETENTIPESVRDEVMDDDAELAGGTDPETPAYSREDDLAATIEVERGARERKPLVKRFLEWMTGATAVVASGDVDDEAPTVERQSPFHDSSKPGKDDQGYYYYGEDVVTSAKLD